MNRDNPMLRRLVWPVLLLVLVPPLYFGLMGSQMGVISIMSSGRMTVFWPWLLILAAYPLPVVVLLRWKRLTLSCLLLGLVQFGQAVCASSLPEAPKRVIVTLGDHGQQSGIEVTCNDVRLGTTPLTLTEAEFKAKVPEWTQPPEQPRVSYSALEDGMPMQGNDLAWWSWTWAPGNPFVFPPDHSRMSAFHDGKKLPELLKAERYWWRYQKNGCVTTQQMSAMSGGGGGGRVIRLQLNPSLTVPAQYKMKTLLVSGLHAAEGPLSAQWKAFVLKYRNILLADLISDTKDDERLLAALDGMADEHFRLKSDADLNEYRAAFDRVFESVSKPEEDSFDWFAGRVARRIVQRNPHLLIERVRQEVGSSPAEWLSDYAPAIHGRRELLLDLLAEYPQPELFDLVVYLHGLQMRGWNRGRDSRLVVAMGNSGRPEAIPLIRQWLSTIWDEKADQRFVHDQEREESVRAMTRIFVPPLEDEFRQLVGYRIKPDFFNKFGPLPEFIRSRIRHGDNLPGVVSWLVSLDSLNDEQKAGFLAEVNDADAGVWLRSIADRIGDYKRNELTDEVVKLPSNPHHAAFLMESWLRSYRLQPGYLHSRWNRAILRIDTPEVKQFILDRMKAPPSGPNNPYNEWRQFMDTDQRGSSLQLTHLNWLVEELRKLPPSSEVRYSSMRLLFDIGTDDAMNLLHEIADNPKDPAAGYAKRVLKDPDEYLQKERQKQQEILARLDDLLSERIKPDDLLAEFASAHWNGSTYEPIPAMKKAAEPE